MDATTAADLVGEKYSVTVEYEDLGGGKFRAVRVTIHIKHKKK